MGLMVYVHTGAAAWFTVKVCPEIVMVPDLAAPVLASKLKVTVPLPVPLALPLAICSQVALPCAAAVQVHPACVVTFTEDWPEVEAAEYDEALRVYEHAVGEA